MLLIPSTAFAATTTTSDTTIQSVFVYTYTKTIPYYYSDYSSVPSSKPYSEYVDGYGQASGTLYLQSVVATSPGWTATYSGTMYCFYH